MKINLAVVSLGCAKNLIDTECMLGALNDKCNFVTDVEMADVVLINTCAFINDAKQESIDTILDYAQLKKDGSLKAIIVSGCLTEMFRDDLPELLPEVDYFCGVDAYKDISEIIDRVIAGESGYCFNNRIQPSGVLPRVITTMKPTAYVKIAEGCDNRCSYCVIPDIRGEYQSRSKEDILTEVYTLVSQGYNEIVLIAQDTTLYGNDLTGRPDLPDLLARVALTPGIKWVRVLYCYPQLVNEELIDTMLKYDTIVPYLDIPVQNFSDGILNDMNRRYNYEKIKSIVNMVRSKSDRFILRTTLITGFPGETEDDFRDNLERLKELEFDRLGVFQYSQEAGTIAGDMPVQISEEEKGSRYAELMEAQLDVSGKLNMKRIGKQYEVLVEGLDEDSGMFYGRSYAEAPDADGKIFIESSEELLNGYYYNVEIVYAYDIDLKGVLV